MALPDVLLQISVLLAVAVLVGVGAKPIGVPLTVVLTITGFAANVLFGPLEAVEPMRGEMFESVLVFVFLPALVFAAVFGLSVRSFLRNLAPVLALATVAFTVSAVLVGVTMAVGLGIPIAAALLFGALISATDPVAVVAIFNDLGVPKRILTLVEGESLLNDGVAIVLFEILLAAAVGEHVSVPSGMVSLVTVFTGGAAIGFVIGFLAAMALPWMDRLSAGALTVAVAYGSFVVADHLLGLSGVVATACAGLVLAGLGPSRASAEVRELWEQLWESIDYIANALLFLAIGLVLQPSALTTYAGPILLAIVAVLVARPLAVVPVISALERFGHIPRVGHRNEAVLVWGGLRGGVALALALALPESLEQRDLFVALTAGVVLATLLLNATTIGPLVRRLGLDQPDRTDRFMTAWASLRGARAARQRLEQLDIDDATAERHLQAVEDGAERALAELDLEPSDEARLVSIQGLLVERDSYQRLSDAGLLPPPVTRTLLREVDDQIEEMTLGRTDLGNLRQRERSRAARLGQRIAAAMPQPPGEAPDVLSFAEATARQVAAHRTVEALGTFEGLPSIGHDAVEGARQTFVRLEQEAIAELDEIGGDESTELAHHQAEALSRAAAREELDDLVGVGLLPRAIAERADEVVEHGIAG